MGVWMSNERVTCNDGKGRAAQWQVWVTAH
jgi:hypothetical protein